MNRRLAAQTGLVLPLVLIFLVIMMLLGTAVIRNVSLEEKMAGNMRNRNLAFQAAEQALRFCESSIQLNNMAANNIVIQPEGPPTNGSGVSYWDVESNWTGSSPVAVAVPRSTGEVSANATEILQQRPQCMVESFTSGSLISAHSPPTEKHNRKAFRITARGVGLDQNTVVKLQSYLITR